MLSRVPEARVLGPDAGGQWVRWWRSAGWEREVDAWVGRRLGERGRRLAGEAVTYRARFWSVVRCYPTDDGLVWFKENNPGHRFEAGLVAAMAQVAPEYVVLPIAVDRQHIRCGSRGNCTTVSSERRTFWIGRASATSYRWTWR